MCNKEERTAAVNWLTASGRVAAPEQRVTADQALRGVTIEAAFSLKLENEIGTITPGKRANFTVLSDNPLSVDPARIRDIAVWGTVMEDRVLPAGPAEKKASLDLPQNEDGKRETAFARAAMHHALEVSHFHD